MKNLLKTSLSFSFVGILLLLFISNFIQSPFTEIQDITNQSLNQKIQVSGQITNVKSYENSNFQVLTIKDETGQIDITMSKILNLTNIKQIEVIGTITEYKGKLQIQVDKIISSSESPPPSY